MILELDQFVLIINIQIEDVKRIWDKKTKRSCYSILRNIGTQLLFSTGYITVVWE